MLDEAVLVRKPVAFEPESSKCFLRQPELPKLRTIASIFFSREKWPQKMATSTWLAAGSAANAMLCIDQIATPTVSATAAMQQIFKIT